jgi:hypothetical protein
MQFLIFNKKIKDDSLDTKGIIIVLTRIIPLSDFVVHTFYEDNLLTQEESQHKDEIIDLTEQILDANGLM